MTEIDPREKALRIERRERMRAVYERNKRLRSRATSVVNFGDPSPSKAREGTYVESATAARLRRVFEEGETPWWQSSS